MFEITHIYSLALSDILIFCLSSGGYTYQTVNLNFFHQKCTQSVYLASITCCAHLCIFFFVHLMIARFPGHRNLCDIWPFWFAWIRTLVRFWKCDYPSKKCISSASLFVCLPGALFYPLLTTIPPYNQFNFLFHQPAPTSCKQFYHRHPAIIFIKILN